MTILAIDTSTDYLSLAISRDGKIIARFHRKMRMRHSSMLVPMIERILKRARVKLEAVDCFCISAGPGSFTGLRIGVTTVKGLAFAMNKPTVAVPTMDVIARNVKGHAGVICPVLDARKKKVYAALYKSDGKSIKKISKDLLLSPEDLLRKIAGYERVFFLGDALNIIGRTENIGFDWRPRAEKAACLAEGYIQRKIFTDARDLEPLYLYSKECDVTGR